MQAIPLDPTQDLLCPRCGYILRGSSSMRCPECGLEIDYARLRESQLPWARRRHLGSFRAYWKTVWLVLRRPRQLSAEMVRPVSFADAQRFRWSTLSRVYVPLLLATAVLYLLDPFQSFRSQLMDWAYHAVWPMIVFHACFLLFLALASGAPSLFFHPREMTVEQQNRAVALSYYTLAPLGAMPLAYIASFFLYWADVLFGRPLWTWKVGGLLGIALPVLLIVLWYAAVLKLARAVFHDHAERMAGLAVGLLLLWGLLFGVILVVLPGLLAYVVVMARSWF